MGICIVDFSSRGNGNCAQISAFLKELTGGTVYSFSGLEVSPCGTCDYQCFRQESCPHREDGMEEIMEAVSGSDRTYFVLPNYCGFPCANFFIFNERSVAWFRGSQHRLKQYLAVPKGAVVISNSEPTHIRDALAYQADKPVEILTLSSREFGQSSLAGKLLAHSEVRDRIRNYVNQKEDPKP